MFLTASLVSSKWNYPPRHPPTHAGFWSPFVRFDFSSGGADSQPYPDVPHAVAAFLSRLRGRKDLTPFVPKGAGFSRWRSWVKLTKKEKRLPAPWWNSCRLSVQGTFHQPLCGLDERPAWVYTLNPWSIIILIYTRWTAVSSPRVNGNQSIFDFGAKKKVPWPVQGVFLTAGITFSPPCNPHQAHLVLSMDGWCIKVVVTGDTRLKVASATLHTALIYSHPGISVLWNSSCAASDLLGTDVKGIRPLPD